MQRTADLAEALAMANDSDHGLASYVFGDSERTDAIARQLRSAP